jgi:hypothetical protein
LVEEAANSYEVSEENTANAGEQPPAQEASSMTRWWKLMVKIWELDSTIAKVNWEYRLEIAKIHEGKGQTEEDQEQRAGHATLIWATRAQPLQSRANRLLEQAEAIGAGAARARIGSHNQSRTKREGLERENLANANLS